MRRKKLVIIGGGAGGASVAAEAKRRNPALTITIVEQGAYVSVAACPMPYYIGDVIKDQNHLIARTPEEFRKGGIEVLTNTTAVELDTDQRVVKLSSGRGLSYDYLVLATGSKAQRLGISGEDLEGVFTFKTLADAFRMKSYLTSRHCRKAGRNIGDVQMSFPGVVGAQSFRIFNLEVAAAGLGEKEAADSGYEPVSTIIWGSSIAKVMPGAKSLGIKLLADKITGQLLGAQSVGEIGAVNRINALSVALWSGLNIDDIANLDLAYSPFFSGPWDVIHIAAQNLKKQMTI
jgi:NADPH-dependent 2,4-dienoyl-CoA reductase/sulfur reductase-like enzyme